MRRPNGTTPNWWSGGKCAGQTEQHQIGGSAANAPANERECGSAMRCAGQTEQQQIGGLAKNAPANKRECGVAMRCAGRTATPNRWIVGECAGKRKRMWRVDEMRLPNEKKRRRGDGMHWPKEKEEVLENEGDEFLVMEHHLTLSHLGAPLVRLLQYFTSDLGTIVCIRRQCCPTQHARPK